MEQVQLGEALWRTNYYFGWTATNATYPGNGDGRVDEIRVGTTQTNANKVRLEYDYDSFGNVAAITENST
ncbi:MAG: hypothetical protein KDE31_01410, partial [Caldilineaceae bacterium]|nr:hypothetical protein [Caldilineaceae bacterium]